MNKITIRPEDCTLLGRIIGRFRRWRRRRPTTTYHRCLAVHIHFAGKRSALD